jgi:hypothetical protein
MKVQLARNGKTLALTRPQKMFAQDRMTVEVGYAGDGTALDPVCSAGSLVTGRFNPLSLSIASELYRSRLVNIYTSLVWPVSVIPHLWAIVT